MTLPARLKPDADAGHLLPGRGPLIRVAAGAPTSVNGRIRTAWRARHLIRLATGTYAPAEEWTGLAPWDRYTLSAAAYAASHPGAVFTGVTAAHLHGLPLAAVPEELLLRATSRGHRARRPMASAASRDGRRDDAGPAPPQVRWTWNAVTAPAPETEAEQRRREAAAAPDGTVPHAPRLPPVTIESALTSGTALGPVTVDPLPTVQLMLGSTLPFREAIPPLDGLRRASPAPSERWAEAHVDRLGSRAARQRFERAWGFTDARAESAGESLSRALIHELGFAEPRLQRVIHGRDGRRIARVDFWWEQVNVAGEFDGIGKYDIALHDTDAERRRSIRREKEREVALRRVCRDVARWTWSDLTDPAGLAAELVRVGVPRRPP